MAPKQKVEVTDGSNLDPEASLSTHDRYLREQAKTDEERAEEAVVAGRDFRIEEQDVSGFVGVSPEYMNYATENEKPLQAEEGTFQRAAEDAAVVPGEGLVYSAVSGDAYKELAKKKADDAKAQADENQAKAEAAAKPDEVKATDGDTATVGGQTAF